MKIHPALLSLPCLLLFSSCDDDSPSPNPGSDFDAISLHGQAVNFDGVVEFETFGQGLNEITEFQLRVRSTFDFNPVGFEVDGTMQTVGDITAISFSSNNPGILDGPQPGDVLAVSELNAYAYDPERFTGTLTIYQYFSTDITVTRSLTFDTPFSGTWTQFGTGVTPSGLTRRITGSGSFVILNSGF